MSHLNDKTCRKVVGPENKHTLPSLMASITSKIEYLRSVTSNSFHELQISRILSRVIPGKIVPSNGAVTSSSLSI